MIYAAPGAAGAKLTFKAKYDNFIGGKWTAPVKGEYFDNITPITGKPYCKVARSSAEDIELALDAAHAARQAARLVREARFETLCVHGDSPDAVVTARAVRAVLDAG